jgi:hypothetical protein
MVILHHPVVRSGVGARLVPVLVPGLAAVLWGVPPAAAQDLVIGHVAIRCVVAGKYPKLSACFSPASDLAGARVYFHGEGAAEDTGEDTGEGTTEWYFVEMTSDAPCFQGTLPRPKLSLEALRYYVEGVGRSYGPSRTEEIRARVVKDASECDRDEPVAPIVPNATVVVSSLAGGAAAAPGFIASAGLSAGVVTAAVVGAGAAVAGGAALAGGDDGGGPPSSGDGGGPTTSPGTTTPASTVPPSTAPPTTAAPQANRPPVASFRVNPDPPEGRSPLDVRFNMCDSSDPDGDALLFTFDFGDGEGFRGFCRAEHSYRQDPDQDDGGGSTVESRYAARICVSDRMPDHDRCHDYAVRVVDPRPRGCPDTAAPTLHFQAPPSGISVTTPTLRITVDFSDDVGVTGIDVIGTRSPPGPTPLLIASVASPSNPLSIDWQVPQCNESDYRLTATASDACGNQGRASVDIAIRTAPTGVCPGAVDAVRLEGSRPHGVSFLSDLGVPGSAGQIVVNGRGAVFVGPGRSPLFAEVRPGVNRVEAVLVHGRGEVGSWRFELDGAVEPGSLHVVAGNGVRLEDRLVELRLEGHAGERLVFTFVGR